MNIFVYEAYETRYDHHAVSDYLKSKGHNVVVYDPTKLMTLNYKCIILRRIFDKFFNSLITFLINHFVMNLVKKDNFDLAIIVRGEHLLPLALSFMKEKNITLYNWSTDDFFNENTSLKIMKGELVRQVIAKYDCIFTPRIHLEAEYRRCGAKSLELINWYYRPFLRDPNNLIPVNYCFDVSFIGAWSAEREKWLSSLEGLPIHVWGWGWEKRASKYFKKNNFCHSTVSMFQMSEIFNKSRININLLTIQNRDTSNFRNFEIPAACGFQLSEASTHINSLFAADIEIALFYNQAELLSKVNCYLKDSERREQIAIAGYKAVIKHDFASRVDQIIGYKNLG